MEHTGDRSEFVSGLIQVVTVASSNVASILNEEFYPIYLNKLVEHFCAKYMETTYKCNKINELGAQQMSLDTDELKMEFLKLSSFKPAEGFANIASRHFTRTKNLLKIMSA